MSDDQGLHIRWSVVVQVVSWVVGLLLTYSAMNARVAVVETRYDQLRDQVSEIRNDVKQLLRQKP